MKYAIATLLFAAAAFTYAESPAHLTAEEWLEQHIDAPEPPLHTAAAAGNAEECRRLIAEGADVNAPSIPPMPEKKQGYGETPLMLAARNGHIDICRLLLASGAVADETTLYECATPLCEAAAAGHSEICSLLLHAGAEVNAYTRTCTTPLMLAALNGHADTCRQLLAAGADARAIDREGDTPLHYALNGILSDTSSPEACMEIISLLIQAGAHAKYANDDEETPIDRAALIERIDILQHLLDESASATPKKTP